MAYKRERDARRFGKGTLIATTLFMMAAVVLPVLVFSRSILNDSVFRCYCAVAGLVYFGFCFGAGYCLIKGGRWSWEVNDEAVILESPGPIVGAHGHIRLDDIVEIRREGNESWNYYIVDRNQQRWWLSSNPGFDIQEFIREIQRKRSVPYVESNK